jgi:hypothetical protein
MAVRYPLVIFDSHAIGSNFDRAHVLLFHHSGYRADMPESTHTPTLLDPDLRSLASRDCAAAADLAEHFALERLEHEGESVEWCLASSRSLREIADRLLQPFAIERVGVMYDAVRAASDMIGRCAEIVTAEHDPGGDSGVPNPSHGVVVASYRTAMRSLGEILQLLER